ncbi:hypothetical protein GGTG_02184 [Gaeumannomyces tritici R3-111a-1]|uniref:Uncharacterized protein n=1 Tax=Gaeumannomyces tritici (strain R3-111a-1) TaxID=644352 RepID=J3NLN5_GAET3|nr:hypothetical protein GGTG_02184 [Gaeumannomyces tritici R3-111a-1]EJT82210.1 hypothetical protein GGTG_02184 [Gaeumannomyces tritici R3-111a-1]
MQTQTSQPGGTPREGELQRSSAARHPPKITGCEKGLRHHEQPVTSSGRGVCGCWPTPVTAWQTQRAGFVAAPVPLPPYSLSPSPPARGASVVSYLPLAAFVPEPDKVNRTSRRHSCRQVDLPGAPHVTASTRSDAVQRRATAAPCADTPLPLGGRGVGGLSAPQEALHHVPATKDTLVQPLLVNRHVLLCGPYGHGSEETPDSTGILGAISLAKGAKAHR